MSARRGAMRQVGRQAQLEAIRRDGNRPHLVTVAHPEPEPDQPEPDQPEPDQPEQQAAETESAAHASEPAMAEAEPQAVEPAQPPTKSDLARLRTQIQRCVDQLTKYGIPVNLRGTQYDAEVRAIVGLLVGKGIVSQEEMALHVMAQEASLLSEMVQQVVATRGGLIVPGRN